MFITLCVVATIISASPVSARTTITISNSVHGSYAHLPRWVTLAGSLPPNLRLAHRLQPIPAKRMISINVTLRVRDEAGLNRFLTAVNNPNSPSYHHFLTSRDFAQRFGPSPTSRAATIAWLTSLHLQVVGTSSNGVQITARGTVSTLQNAFASSLYAFRQGSRTFMANTRPLRIPGNLAADVVAVSGLTTEGQQHTATVARPRQTFAVRGYTPSDLAHIYGIDSLHTQGFDGRGGTLAIASFADYSSSNIATFDKQFSITSPVSRVRISDGNSTGASLGANNGQAEAEIDIEIAQGIAPRAAILLYEAPNSSPGAVAMYNRIVSDNRAAVVTTSWGGWESSYPSTDMDAIHQAVKEGAAQGQTFLAASGDNGAFDSAGNGPNTSTTLAVDYPASDPWVTGVGGTSLTTNGTQYVNETAWSDSSDPHTPIGSGGGLSSVYSRPSYQVGPGVSNTYSNGMRQVPDVSANADPNSGYAIYTVNPHRSSSWGVGGGTSASAPLWAGFLMVTTGALGRRIGFLNPLLYELGQRASTFSVPPFHDVTGGTNLYYPATVGWDFATGWGSLNGSAFVTALRTLPLPAIEPTATATPRPTSTSTPQAARPSVAIKQVLLLHVVNGKQQRTSKLKVGEKGTLVILYKSAHAGSLHPVGTMVIRWSGRVLRMSSLKPTLYGGKPALTVAVRITSVRRIGTLLASVTVKLGSASTASIHTFKVVPHK
ncbi:MAG: hypothetical protein NVSMB52_00050 [Chloroflexota bacterium]